MSEMKLERTAYVSASVDVLTAAQSLAWATGAGTVCLNIEAVIHNLDPETVAEQQLFRLLEQANELGAGDLIMYEV